MIPIYSTPTIELEDILKHFGTEYNNYIFYYTERHHGFIVFSCNEDRLDDLNGDIKAVKSDAEISHYTKCQIHERDLIIYLREHGYTDYVLISV